MSVCYISIISVYLFIVLYIKGKHLTTIGKNVLLNTNYSQNTSLFMNIFLSHFITNINPMLDIHMWRISRRRIVRNNSG